MLRRKLLIYLGPLVLLLLLSAILAILMLQDVLGRLEHVSAYAATTVQQTNRLSRHISAAEVELSQLLSHRKRHLDDLDDTLARIRADVDDLRKQYVVHEPASAPALEQLTSRVHDFTRHAFALSTATNPQDARIYNQRALEDVASMRQDIQVIAQHASAHSQAEQADVASRFKWLVLGLSIIFLLVINIAVIVLLRTAGMILKPIEKLVEASRHLADENFAHRVILDQKDEFDQLARAYNSMAQQLQASEQRKLETLQQVALALNHELNNAMAIIEMQLSLLSRQASASPASDRHLRQIRQSLQRMADTLQKLKQVRRIVLTDYIEGTKMLDLQKSVEEPAQQHA